MNYCKIAEQLKLAKEKFIFVITNEKEVQPVGCVLPNTLVHGDCLEVMKYIPSGSVDMVLCDPPYG